MKKALRYLLFLIGFVVLAVVLFFVLTIIPLDRTPYKQKDFYPVMMSRLDSLGDIPVKEPSRGFSIGYGVVNLTPAEPTATAGYGNRRGKKYTTVHDSIFVRAVVISNGAERVAIVSADLLIIPPAVTSVLQKDLPAIGFSLNNTYLNATHTHNSIGNWGEGAAGFIYGDYDQSMVQFIAQKIIAAVQKASESEVPGEISTGTVGVPSAVKNRVDKQYGMVDTLLRVVQITRSDSTRMMLLSYNAHPTCLFSKDLDLSRDYPGRLVDLVEEQGYDFAMFLSGAVGSHGANPPEFGKSCIDWMANEIDSKLKTVFPTLEVMSDTSLFMRRIPLALGDPQIKISKDWRLRPWVFNKAFGQYQPYLTALRIGDLVLLGTPCDFSGQMTGAIDKTAALEGLQVIVTSFNGHYIGYITADQYYDYDHYETRLMNWYGPGNGAYMTECLQKMVEAVAD